MIIFMDDLAPRGLTAAELEEGGADAARWPEVEQAHLDRIRDTLTVLPCPIRLGGPCGAGRGVGS